MYSKILNKAFYPMATILMAYLLLHCSENDSLKNTSFLNEYPVPSISNIENFGDKLKVTINQRFDINIHQELDQLILVRDEKNGIFENLNKSALSSLDKIEEIPYFLAAATNLNLTTYSFTIELELPNERIAINDAHAIKVLSKGSNEVYGRAFENNGWITSPLSDSKTIYLSPKQELELNNFHFFSTTPNSGTFYGFSISNDGNGAAGVDTACNQESLPNSPTESSCDVIFSIENNDGQLAPHLLGPCTVTALAERENFLENQPGVYSTKADTLETLLKPAATEKTYSCAPIPVRQYSSIIARGKNGGFAKILPKSTMPIISDTTGSYEFNFHIYVQPGNISEAIAF